VEQKITYYGSGKNYKFVIRDKGKTLSASGMMGTSSTTRGDIMKAFFLSFLFGVAVIFGISDPQLQENFRTLLATLLDAVSHL
jgi:hypothetical protein